MPGIWLTHVDPIVVRRNCAAIDVKLDYPRAGGKAQETHCGVFRQTSDNALALFGDSAVLDALHGQTANISDGGIRLITINTLGGSGWTRSTTPPAGRDVVTPKNVSGWTLRPARDGLGGAR